VLDTTTPGDNNYFCVIPFVFFSSRNFILEYIIHNDQVFNGEHDFVKYTPGALCLTEVNLKKTTQSADISYNIN